MSGKLRSSFLSASLMGVLLLAGCASMDLDAPKETTTSLPPSNETRLAIAVAGRAGTEPGDSGFRAIGNGIEALAARLALADMAEHSIDAQYYLINDDRVGGAFVAALLRAADRGVRVRVLLDDIQTKGYDAGMAGLASHPNFDIRVFNPFGNRSGRWLDGVTNFSRINRRMHNKSFTVDGKVTLIGGRNIASEYFGAREDRDFGDLDVIAIGPVVQDVSEMFDLFWNGRAATPLETFVRMPGDSADELRKLRDLLAETDRLVVDTPFFQAVRERMVDYVPFAIDRLFWAPYDLVYDSPDKARKHLAKEAPSIRTSLFSTIGHAQSEVIIISPYFVPREGGIQALADLHTRGVDVTVITNSLASNNQASVHGGYAPSREPLLRRGVRIHELRADIIVSGAEIVATEETRATLHTKSYMVDAEHVFIGSFNFDPRSAYINTELGVIIHSPELGKAFVDYVHEQLSRQTYEVFLDEKDRLRWRGFEDGNEVVLDHEPQTTWFQRARASFMTLLPIKGQL